MGMRLFAVIAVFVALPGLTTRQALPGTFARIHDDQICWDPDVEFPVPCDDD